MKKKKPHTQQQMKRGGVTGKDESQIKGLFHPVVPIIL